MSINKTLQYYSINKTLHYGKNGGYSINKTLHYGKNGGYSINKRFTMEKMVVPIFLTSYIAVSMSVLKFKRYTETLEELTKISEKLVFVVCRLRRVVEDSHMCKNLEELNQVKLTYSKEPFDLFMNCRESLDRTMKFQDVVYYSKKLDKWQEDIETDVPWFKRICCALCRSGKAKRRYSHHRQIPIQEKEKNISSTESMLELGFDESGSDKSD